MFGMFVPIVDFTQNDEEGNSHMSDIPLQLPARANVASDNSALVTIPPAEGVLVRNVCSKCKPGRHPSLSATFAPRSDRWKCSVRLHRCSVLSQHNSQKSKGTILKILRSVTGPGCRGFWNIAMRHILFMILRLQVLLSNQMSSCVSADHCHHGRRWRMTIGFVCGNIDQRHTEMPSEGLVM